MKKAYIVLAHKNPKQLHRLIQVLDDGQSVFFVHIDKRKDINDFSKVWNYGPQVMMIERENTSWGGFGLVEATLNALRAVVESGINFGMVSLLSGEDYPIKSNVDIDRYFESSPYSLFIDYAQLPDFGKWTKGGGLYRINKFFFGLSIPERLASRTINLIGLFIPPLKRQYTIGLKPYWGSQWWSIDMYSVKFILEYVQINPAYSMFHRFTFAPDEVFFQTILLNAEDEHIKGKLKNDAKRFMVWEQDGHAHPKVFRTDDLHNIIESDALFARKFDTEIDEEILDLIDRECLKTYINNNSSNNAARA